MGEWGNGALGGVPPALYLPVTSVPVCLRTRPGNPGSLAPNIRQELCCISSSRNLNPELEVRRRGCSDTWAWLYWDACCSEWLAVVVEVPPALRAPEVTQLPVQHQLPAPQHRPRPRQLRFPRLHLHLRQPRQPLQHLRRRLRPRRSSFPQLIMYFWLCLRTTVLTR
jgi:hypothetical protein